MTTIQLPEETLNLDSIEIEAVRDLFIKQIIIAKIKGIPTRIILWEGPEEYAAASNWTNESATARATELLSLSSIPWLVD